MKSIPQLSPDIVVTDILDVIVELWKVTILLKNSYLSLEGSV